MLSTFVGIDLAAPPSIASGAVRAHKVPLVVANAESLRGYGHIVPDFASGRVTIVTWPQPGWRLVVPGTGNEGGVVEDRFEMMRQGELQLAVNHDVGRSYITGSFVDREGPVQDLLLGVDFLRAHHVLVSYSQNKIYFSYAGGAAFQ